MLYLGNLSSLRDWGYAKDYVECMWLILQQDKAEDFVIATGEQHSVREFCELAFRRAGIEAPLGGQGRERKGCRRQDGKSSGRGLARLLSSYRCGESVGRSDQGPQRVGLGSRPKDVVRGALST